MLRFASLALLLPVLVSACIPAGDPVPPVDEVDAAASPAAGEEIAESDEIVESDEIAESESAEAPADEEIVHASAALLASYPPSRNFDLTHWKLTLPSGQEVKTVELNSGYAYAGVFYTDRATGGMVFRCPNIAGTTANSSYSRTELRELLAPEDSNSKSDANNWTTADGGTLKATLRVDRVSTTGEAKKVGRVIIGQIHGPDTTEVMRLYYSKKPTDAKGRIYVAMESVSGATTYSPDLISNANGAGIALGERFRYEIRLAGTKLRVVIRRPDGTVLSTYVKYIDPGYVGKNLYFKAGVYNQNNTGDPADYVQATFFALTHTHP